MLQLMDFALEVSVKQIVILIVLDRPYLMAEVPVPAAPQMGMRWL